MPWLGYQLLGTVGSKPLTADVPYLGTLETLDDVLRDTAAEELVAALDSDEFDAMARIVNLSEKYGLKFSLIPYFATYMISRPYIDQVGSLPLVNLRRIPLDNMFNAFVKRATDIAGSLLCLLDLFQEFFPLFGELPALFRFFSFQFGTFTFKFRHPAVYFRFLAVYLRFFYLLLCLPAFLFLL